MSENEMSKKSIVIFIIGSLIFFLASIFLKDGSYLAGFILGYLLGVMAFIIIIKSTTMILNLREHLVYIIIGMNILKLAIYALGLILAIKIPSIFSLLGVFIGYFIIKLTIYYEAYRNKGGDLHE